MVIPDPKVYQAARAFAQGEPDEKIEALLLNCFDFDEDDVERLLALAKCFSDEIDGGYSAFLNFTNLLLRTDVYCVELTKTKHIRNKLKGKS